MRWLCEGCHASGVVPEDFDYATGTLHYCPKVKNPFDEIPTIHIYEGEQ